MHPRDTEDVAYTFKARTECGAGGISHRLASV
jgi:hypothetical protein